MWRENDKFEGKFKRGKRVKGRSCELEVLRSEIASNPHRIARIILDFREVAVPQRSAC